MTLPPALLKILSRPHRIVFLVAVLLLIIVGLQAWKLIVDQPINEAQVTAHQIRVDQTTLKKFQTSLTSYQHPPTAPALSAPVFRANE